MTETTSADSAGPDPVINVIEREPAPDEGGAGGASGAGAGGPGEGLDRAARQALEARRRREFDAARARLREQAMRDDPGQAQPGDRGRSAGAGSYSADTRTPAADDAWAKAWAPLGEAPERVRKRYLRAGNQYFLKDAPYQMAFEDLGPYLVTQHNRPDVVESMVDMVKAKSWERIRVSGHESFRREAWLQATLLGLHVTGYEPKAADLARLGEGRRELMTNRIGDAGPAPSGTEGVRQPASPSGPSPVAQPAQSMQPTQAAGLARTSSIGEPRTPPVAAAQPVSAESPDGREAVPGAASGRAVAHDTGGPQEPDTHRYTGELVEYGGAPYQHNPARSNSYYVVYRDEAGADHAVWGVDLERAIAESGARIGERVSLQNLGKRWVTVDVPVVDAAGEITGYEEKEVYRNTWHVDVEGRERPAPAASPASRDASGRESPAGTGENSPRVSRTPRRAREADAIDAVDGQRAMQMAVIVAAMRAQGFSDRSIARVEQHAGKLYDTFRAEGVRVPVPKVFDPKAPSARTRAGRAAPERSAAREVERTPSEPSQPSL